MTLLLPSLQKAREKAKQAVCLSNSRQTGIAIQTYSIDSQRYAPTDTGQKSWYERLIPGYLPEGEIVRGPSKVMECPEGVEITKKGQSTIAMNYMVSGKSQNSWNQDQKSFIKATANETMLLMDAYSNWRSIGIGNMKNGHLILDSVKTNVVRHGKKANVIYLDGSGKARTSAFFLSKNDNTDTFWDPEI